jgi:hypothetical protein
MSSVAWGRSDADPDQPMTDTFMTWIVILIVTALPPFISVVFGIPRATALSFNQGLGLSMIYGIAWVLLFLYAYERARGLERRRILFLIPFGLLAFSPPLTLLVLAWRLMSSGVPP